MTSIIFVNFVVFRSEQNKIVILFEKICQHIRVFRKELSFVRLGLCFDYYSMIGLHDYISLNIEADTRYMEQFEM